MQAFLPFPSAGTAGCFWTFSCFPEDVKRDWHCRQQSCIGHTAVVSTGQGVVQRFWHLPVSRVSEDPICSRRLDRLSSAEMSLEVCVTLDETRYLICSLRSNCIGEGRGWQPRHCGTGAQVYGVHLLSSKS